MALILVDGKPGSGKTQYAIRRCMEMSAPSGAADARQVFYASGRDSLRFTEAGQAKLQWTKIDANEWQKCPVGSVILIDEVQFIWPSRPSGSKVPDYISDLATHRHQGFDIVIVTQDGSLIDQNVRKIASPYIHLERPFNQAGSKVWTFDGFVPWNMPSEQAKAEVSRVSFDKDVWELYESAAVHTHAARFPKRVLWIPVALVAVAAAGWFVNRTLTKPPEVPAGVKLSASSPAKGPGAAQPGPGFGGLTGDPRRKQTVAEWMADRRPRVSEMPHTAPLYDDLTKPLSFPLVSACVERAKTGDCMCYSQQGTPMEVAPRFCKMYVQHGAFDHFLPDQVHGQGAGRNGPVMAPGPGGGPGTARPSFVSSPLPSPR